MEKLAWKPVNNNWILEGENFYVSYNPATGGDHNPFTDLGNILSAMVGGGELQDGEETALCIKTEEGRKWYILEGDFRKNYERAVPKGAEACLRVYLRNKKNHRSNWSTD